MEALLTLLIAEISVESRTEIKPTYRVPVDVDEDDRPTREKVELVEHCTNQASLRFKGEIIGV